jgi:hypothetical protein
MICAGQVFSLERPLGNRVQTPMKSLARPVVLGVAGALLAALIAAAAVTNEEPPMISPKLFAASTNLGLAI